MNDKQQISRLYEDMLLFVTDGKPSERRFMEKLADVCEEYGIEPE